MSVPLNKLTTMETTIEEEKGKIWSVYSSYFLFKKNYQDPFKVKLLITELR